MKKLIVPHLSETKIFWNALKMPCPVTEYKFHKDRRWRLDYAWPDVKLAVEIEGGVYNYGGHNSISGFKKDIDKYNALTEDGWHLLRYLPKKINYTQIQKVYIMLK